MDEPPDVDAYIASLLPERREPMQQLRRAIRAAAPDAEETIAYKMPAFRSHGGQFLVSFDAYKRHYSLFPATDAMIVTLGDRLVPYLAGKGTIRFPADRPIPVDLVADIVRIRLTENTARAKR